jgi:ElaB/YqjD/DUF883 family membrane-anchored ribosome-binding protein
MMNATTDNSQRGDASNRNPSELEREGEELRADLDRTLDEIGRKLSPQELMDRSMEFVRNNGSEFLREAGETIRRNPVPVLLTAAGLIWLTASVAKSRSGASSSASSDWSRADGEDSAGFGGSSGSKYENGEDNFGQSRSGSGGVRARVQQATRSVKGKLSSSVHAVQGRTQGARSQFGDLVQEQPIALGAIALAAGALLGAALPVTRYENELMGPVHDKAMARAKELGQRQYENIRESVASSMQQGQGRGEDQDDIGQSDGQNNSQGNGQRRRASGENGAGASSSQQA